MTEAARSLELEALGRRFLEACGVRLREIEEAASRRDFDSIMGHAHALRGSGGAFGFDVLSQLGASLQAAAHAADVAQLQVHTAELRRFLTEHRS